MTDNNGDSLSLRIVCDRCDEPLTEPGGLAFGPPADGLVHKFHICVRCWPNVADEIIRAAVSEFDR